MEEEGDGVGGEEEDKEKPNGGKKRKAAASNGDVKKTSKKTKITTTTTKTQKPTKVLPDYVTYLVSLDLKWHAYLKDALRQASDAYLAVLDTIGKNRSKVENPKGGGAGGDGANHMSMF